MNHSITTILFLIPYVLFFSSSCVGEMQTYWLERGDRSDTMSKGSTHGTGSTSEFDTSNHCVFSSINENFEEEKTREENMNEF